MIIVIKPDSKPEEVERLSQALEERGFHIHRSQGRDHLILGLIGDTKSIEESTIRSQHIVEKVIRVNEPYKKANRAFHPADSVYNIGGA